MQDLLPPAWVPGGSVPGTPGIVLAQQLGRHRLAHSEEAILRARQPEILAQRRPFVFAPK